MDNNNNNIEGRKGSANDIEMRNQDSFGQRLKERRLKLGITQKRLAKVVGVSVTTIQTYEYGVIPRGEYLTPLSNALKCSTDWLLTGQDATTSTSATPTTARAGPGSVSAEYIPEAADTFRTGGPVGGFGRAAMMLSDIFNSRDQDAIRSITAFLEALWTSTRSKSE